MFQDIITAEGGGGEKIKMEEEKKNQDDLLLEDADLRENRSETRLETIRYWSLVCFHFTNLKRKSSGVVMGIHCEMLVHPINSISESLGIKRKKNCVFFN